MVQIQQATKHSSPHPTVSTCEFLQADNSGFVILARCTSSIPTTTDTFQHGCIMWLTDTASAANTVFQNTGTTTTPVWSPMTPATLPSPLFVSDNSNGANNAITVSLFTVGTTKAVITTGSRVAIKLTHTLQKGANTVNVNGTSKPLVNSTNPANQLTTGYAVGGVIEVVYLNGVLGGVWEDLKQ